MSKQPPDTASIFRPAVTPAAFSSFASRLASLYDHEAEALLEALRRDVRSETLRAESGGEWADVHRQNARHSINLLQIINPKHAQP